VLIPCILLGLFLLTDISVSAKEAVLINSNIDVIRDDTSAGNTYYYAPNESNWHFKIEDYDVTLVKWRVVRPDGKATAWSDYLDISKVSNYAKFDINFDTIGDYSETVDLSGRESVAIANTWWVDIEYYKTNSWFGVCSDDPFLGIFGACEKKDSESVKILKGSEVPTISVEYDDSTMKAKIEAKMMNSANNGTGIITYLGYFLSETKLSADEARKKFDDGTGIKTIIEYKNNDEYGNYFKKTVTSVNSSEYAYMYVYAESFNGQTSLVEKNILNLDEDEKVDEKEDDKKEDGEGTGDKNTKEEGLFGGEYGFGELILIVLIIVLILSCALIITQKIVDYKKRLY
jgi:hypothetical protein